jgi:hypothetical protein
MPNRDAFVSTVASPCWVWMKLLAAVTVQARHDGFAVAQHTVHKSIPVWASYNSAALKRRPHAQISKKNTLP